MRRHSLLTSALLAFVFLLSAGSISRNLSVMAQARSTEGSLLGIDGKGHAGQCPLKHTEVKTEISGFLARTVVTQQFENSFADKIEAVYTFPLPAAAAVDDMTIVVGDRTVKGKIMRREEAQATYDAARSRGQVAALLHQQRPNVFTQAVANILPGQRINVTISYVETLQYDEGSYEWSFPMVVSPRYMPAADSTAQQPAEGETASPEALPDAAQIAPPVMPEGQRAGHDISIEVNIDAGVPLVSFQSSTHEIEALQPNSGKAIVRLKDQATIPNKDFVLRYTVAGNQIEDALLAHRIGKEGFFTFILQPPQRVTAPDVTPKELVFVLDTSGSMAGFPIEKAKETMKLALDGLYPQDTFNVITFAGETHILFPKPVPATPGNLSKAKKLLADTEGNGGTEMMQAIRAALDPSDAQDHMRIACFLTDGQVGNEMEIISEVQKHPRARVFAMGFGSAPNRFLLDKITQNGRGEAEYVADGDTSGVAKRFHERVRNPLLTDVSIEWVGLSVTDVFPTRIPDLFSAKPVIISGKYTVGGKGLIRLKGMMSGQEFVREIPVELPEQETEHDVLATLWARRKIDDLMGQDMDAAQSNKISDDLKTKIVKLGLTYRLMTQFTSFVAVEDASVTDGIEPRRVDVPVEAPQGYVAGSGGPPCGTCATVNALVSVTASTPTMESTDSSLVSRSIASLPLQGRTVQSLFTLAPGTVAPGPTDSDSSTLANISVNGQRPASNNFLVDGVDGNFGIAPGGQSPGASASGNTPALTATGGTNPMASLSTVQEVIVRTFGTAAEFGRSSGGQLSIVTKAGTNDFHGSAFYVFSHEALDANDWFANSLSLLKPRHRLGDFGGTFGGPIQRDHWFFFSSYEGFRLRQPVVALTDVPSLTSRNTAPANTQPLLNLYPLPNRAERPDGFAEFASSFANTGRHDSGSLRVDGMPSSNLSLSGYFHFTNSSADERGAGGLSLNTLNRISNTAQAVTGTASYILSPSVIAELRVNYSHFTSRSSYQLDTFGGALLPLSFVFSQPALSGDNALFRADLNARNAQLMSGSGVSSIQRQFNVLGSTSMIVGTHSFKFGADYRRIFPIIGLYPQEQSFLFDGVTQAITGDAARANFLTRPQSERPVFNETSIYGQDEWRVTPRLTLTYGLRWEISPAPHGSDQGDALAVIQVDDPASLTLAPQGTRLWKTTFGNFAPRVGVVYQPLHDDGLIMRGSFGLLYDPANGAVGDAFADSYPFLNGQSQFNVPFSFAATAPQSANLTPQPFSAFDPHLRMPYLIEWSASVQRSLGSRQSIEMSYVANRGRRLLLTDTLLGQNPSFDFLRLTTNGASSSYRSLQFRFERQLSESLGAMVSYTWAKSVDDFSGDTAARALFRDANLERGPSDFDIRHTLTGYVSYELPAPWASGIANLLTRNWSIDSLFNVRSAAPMNVVYAVPTNFGFLYVRPDLIAGVPLYLNDPTAAGGKRINPAAFSVPLDFRQGTLGRNALREFPLAQFNLALRRHFNFTEDVRLTLGAEADNVFNHPNFATPAGNEASLGTRFIPGNSLSVNPTFGQAYTNAARSSSGIAGSSFGANYYPGGARTLKLLARLEF